MELEIIMLSEISLIQTTITSFLSYVEYRHQTNKQTTQDSSAVVVPLIPAQSSRPAWSIRASSRTARATQRNLVSNKQTKEKQAGGLLTLSEV